MKVDPAVAAAAELAVEGLLTLCQASERLVEEVRGLDPAEYDVEHLDALRAAVCFERNADGTFRGGYAGAPTAPWPRVLTEVPAQVLPVWAAYADHASHSWLRAHLHHLLQRAGAQPAYRHAREAISAYRETVPVFLAADDHLRGPLGAVRALTYGLDLAVGMNQRDLRDEVEREILALVDTLLAAEPVPFGLVLELTEALQARRSQSQAVRELIEKSIAACSEPFLMCRFLQLLRELDPDPAACKAVDARIVAAMLEHADRSPHATRVVLLADAATLARDRGLTDLHRQILLAMQQVKTLGMVRMARAAISFTEQDRAEAVAVVDQADDFADALWRIVGDQPPAGTQEEARDAAIEILSRGMFGPLIARGAVNSAGPVPVAPASDDAVANLQADYQLMQLRENGLALVEQLKRVHERFQPSAEELVDVFAHPLLVSPSKVEMLIHAFQYFWAGQDDAAIHLALPRVEALLREIERDHGVPVLAVAHGNTPGGMSQLGALISAMPAAGFDPDWTRSLALVLHDTERGLNLRNDIGHGLRDCPPRYQVALVLHAALFLLAVAHVVIPLPQPTRAAAAEAQL